MEQQTSATRPGERLVLNTAETCAALDISPGTLKKLITQGYLKPIAGMGSNRFAIVDVRRFVEQGAPAR